MTAGPGDPMGVIEAATRYHRSMPLYEYRCRECDRTFPLLRPIAEADVPAPCPDGHTDVVRALSLVAPRARTAASGAAPAPAGGGGGCCGGACGC